MWRKQGNLQMKKTQIRKASMKRCCVLSLGKLSQLNRWKIILKDFRRKQINKLQSMKQGRKGTEVNSKSKCRKK